MKADALREWLSTPVEIRSFDGSRTRTESPIEAMFASAMDLSTSRARVKRLNPLEVSIKAQQQIGRYRVDFLIVRRTIKLVVECDGHEFHERTKEQAVTDKARDRYLTKEGYRVFRFTGSEIWANPFAAAQEVIDYLLVDYPEDSQREVAAHYLAKLEAICAQPNRP